MGSTSRATPELGGKSWESHEQSTLAITRCRLEICLNLDVLKTHTHFSHQGAELLRQSLFSLVKFSTYTPDDSDMV